MEERRTKKALGSEALGVLLGRWRDGTFPEIAGDWKWIMSYTGRYRLSVLAYTLAGVASASMGIISSVAGKYTIDIITGYQRSRLWLVILIMLGSAAAGLLLRSLTSLISARISLRVNNDIRAEVFDRVLKADWGELNRFPSGDLLSRIVTDAATVAGRAVSWLPELIITLYTFVATLAVILCYDWIMALLALASAPFLLLSSRRLLGRLRDYNREVRRRSSELMAYETETLQNLDSIKGFGVAQRYGDGLRSRQEQLREVSLDYNMFSIRTQAELSLLGTAVQMAGFCYCLYLLWSGKILYGTMTLFLSQSAKLSSAFNSLAHMVPGFLEGSVAARRVRELMDIPPEPELPESEELAVSAGDGVEVCMEQVGFGYQPGQTVLSGVDFSAAPGEIVALIGPSGGGKTTMLRLFLGIVQPGGGRAFLRGADGTEVGMNAALRGCFAYVPQGNTMLSGSVADNLRMVRPEASDEELEQALRAACAWDFVSGLPGGIYGEVGERGHGLSEGQAQRIAIARALLRDAPVLLLDEATSALDEATERQVLRSVMQARPNRTCIVTTHRPSVIGLCQRIYLVSGGAATEMADSDAKKEAMEF